MQVEGFTKNDSPTPVRVFFQAACLGDYLKCMDRGKDLNLEIFNSSVIIYQQQEKKNILYWMPIKSR
jgi:hypothetical protein